MRITVIGMSHVEALRRALPPGEDRIEIINLTHRRALARYVPGGEWLNNQQAIRPRFKQALPRDSHFVSMIGGNLHNQIGLVEHPCRFDFIEPGQEDVRIDADRELVPYDAMRALFEAGLAPFLGWIGEFAQLFAGCRLHLGSPPPIGSAAHIERFPGLLAGKIGLGVAPAALRMKLYRLNAEIVRGRCAGLGIDWVPPPAAAADAAGFLQPAYWKDDPTHGNDAYGRLLLRQIEERLAA